MCIEPIYLWRWIGTESEPNSLFIHWITIKSCTVTPPWTAALLKLSRLGRHTRCIHCPRYELQWPIMMHVTLLTIMLLKMRQLTKWSRVVCVWIHLECRLDKDKSEIVTWAAVGVARQQQICYNSVFKIWQCECNWCGFNQHLMHIRSA